MNTFRKTPVQNKIRTAIIREFFACAQTQPVRISERALAQKYQTTAITVHMVCEDLARVQYLIQIPGKKGYFFNPKWSTQWMRNLYLGVITGTLLETDRPGNTLNSRVFHQLSAVCQSLEKDFASISFIVPKSKTVREAAEEIASMPLNGFLWFAPQKKDLEVIEELRNMEVPILVFSDIFDTSFWVAPRGNALIRDYYTMGCMRACHVAKHHCTKVLYLGEDVPGKTFQGFKDAMKKLNIPFSDKQHFDFTDDLVEKIHDFCRDFTPDGIVANGLIVRYLDDLLCRCPELRNVPFLVEDDLLRSVPPGLKLIKTMDFGKLFAAMGKTAGRILMDLVRKKISNFENMTLTEAEIQASGLKALPIEIHNRSI